MSEQVKTIYEYASEIAQALGEDWEVIRNPNYPSDDVRYMQVRRAFMPSCSFYIETIWNKKNMLCIRGRLEQFKGVNGLDYSEQVHHINVSKHKPLEQIIRDINRRFMPEYLDQHTRNVKAIDAAKNYERLTTHTKEQAENLVREYDRLTRSFQRKPTVYLDSVLERDIYIKVNHIDLDQLTRILNLLREGN